MRLAWVNLKYVPKISYTNKFAQVTDKKSFRLFFCTGTGKIAQKLSFHVAVENDNLQNRIFVLLTLFSFDPMSFDLKLHANVNIVNQNH